LRTRFPSTPFPPLVQYRPPHHGSPPPQLAPQPDLPARYTNAAPTGVFFGRPIVSSGFPRPPLWPTNEDACYAATWFILFTLNPSFGFKHILMMVPLVLPHLVLQGLFFWFFCDRDYTRFFPQHIYCPIFSVPRGTWTLPLSYNGLCGWSALPSFFFVSPGGFTSSPHPYLFLSATARMGATLGSSLRLSQPPCPRCSHSKCEAYYCAPNKMPPY